MLTGSSRMVVLLQEPHPSACFSLHAEVMWQPAAPGVTFPELNIEISLFLLFPSSASAAISSLWENYSTCLLLPPTAVSAPIHLRDALSRGEPTFLYLNWTERQARAWAASSLHKKKFYFERNAVKSPVLSGADVISTPTALLGEEPPRIKFSVIHFRD